MPRARNSEVPSVQDSARLPDPAGHALSAERDAIKPFLDRICSSPEFVRSPRLQRFLTYAVHCALENRNQSLKEYAIAVAVYDKDASFDPLEDPIIRVEASRLRSRLRNYYADAGIDDAIVIELPKGGYVPIIRARIAAPRALDRQSIAVIPFADMADSELQYLSDGFAEGLTRRLARIENLRVVPWSMVLRCKESSNDFARTAQYLEVRTLLVVRFVNRAEAYEVHAEWIDVERKTHLWGMRYRRKLDDVYSIENDIILRLAQKIAPHLSSVQIGEISKQATVDGRAYQLYLRGRHLWNKRTEDALTKAIQFYSRALDHDPGYALALAGKADCSLTLATFAFIPPAHGFPRAKAAAARALELDPSLGEARTVLACIQAVYDWNWAAAECDFQEAMSMSPTYAVAPQWYGALLCARGCFSEGQRLLSQALELDPLSPMIGTQFGVGYYVERRYTEAIRQCRDVLDLDPHFWAALHFRGLSYLATGNQQEALLNVRKAAELSGKTAFALAGLGCFLARLGQKDDAAQILSEMQSRSAVQYVPPYSLALICCHLGDHNQALSYLEQAHEERSHLSPCGWRLNPCWIRFGRSHGSGV